MHRTTLRSFRYGPLELVLSLQLKAPSFWFKPTPTILARLLQPLGWIYAQTVRRRVAQPPAVQLSIPVVSIGNAHLGGVGKTPLCLWLAEQLTNLGQSPAIILRGYGGSVVNSRRVQPGDTADLVGDEALLYARHFPTFVGRDRVASAQAAQAAGASVILWDDGHQNPSLAKDFSIVVYDAAQGVGNGLVFPAGPLREPFARAVAHGRADALVAMGPMDEALLTTPPGLVTYRAEITPDCSVILATGPVVAFAGIGQPEKFFRSLRAAGVELVQTASFGDHQTLTERDLAGLSALGHPLVCTEKDWVRLPADWQGQVTAIPAGLTVQNGVALAEQINLGVANGGRSSAP